MTEAIVIDASVAIAMLLDEVSETESIGRVLSRSMLFASWLWRIEVVNALLVRERRKVLTEAATSRMLQMIDGLPVELVAEPLGRSASALASFARPFQLTSYGALYLELAMHRNLPLYTRDNNLRAAAKRVGVKLV